MTFPEQFNILIRKEGDLYVGTVEELPNVSAFESTYREAREIIQDAICTLKECYEE